MPAVARGCVGGEADLAQRRDRQVVRAPVRLPVIKSVIHAPLRVWRVEDQNLCALHALRSRAIFPVAVAGEEFPSVGGEDAKFAAAHEMAAGIARTGHE